MNAIESYRSMRDDVARLLDVLTMELESRSADAEADPTNWCHLGDMTRVRTQMIDAIQSMSGMTESEVLDFLAESKALS